MLPKLKEVKYRGDYHVWLRFSDGVEGEIDLEQELWGEMFESLKEKERFSELSLDKPDSCINRSLLCWEMA